MKFTYIKCSDYKLKLLRVNFYCLNYSSYLF